MVFTEEPRYFFYPDFGDNLKQPEDKQVSVEIIRPTGYQRKEFTTTVVSREYYPDDQPYNSEGNVGSISTSNLSPFCSALSHIIFTISEAMEAML